MKEFLEALQILMKYQENPPHGPYAWFSDHIRVDNVDTEAMSPEDAARLKELGWWNIDGGSWATA